MSGDFKVAIEGLMREVVYVREMAVSTASIGSAIAGMPGQISIWGPWDGLRTPVSAAFSDLAETVSSAQPGLDSVADLLQETANAYVAQELANTVRIP